jgi:hypothetical protein
MLRATIVTALSLLLVSPAALSRAEDKDKPKKGKKPALMLRAAPREGFSPLTVLITAELKGGDDVEELYCPEVEWEWDDGGRSVQEADCEPWEPGKPIQRRFTNDHLFKESGGYDVRVSLLRLGKVLTTQTLRVTVRPGLGDMNSF